MVPNKVITRQTLCALLSLASCMHTVTAQGGLGPGQSDFISLPAEFASKVPVRLVFSQAELAQCWKDATARRCALRTDLELQQDTWQQAFQASGGTATVPAEGGIFTVTSEPCTSKGVCLPGDSNTTYTIDFSDFPYAMFVESGAILVFDSVQLFALAPAEAYSYSAATPWRSTGGGTTTWPSIGLAPNATLALVNSSVLYVNPSGGDDCIVYTQKRNFAFRQLWGEKNVTFYNATANTVVGPTIRTATIRNGSTQTIVGNASIYYRNVTFICMESITEPTSSGLSPAGLAAAIAVPVGVALLAGCLVATFCLRRRRRRSQQMPPGAGDNKQMLPAGVRDLEAGDKVGNGFGDVQRDSWRDQVKISRDQRGDSCNSSKGVMEPDAAGQQLIVRSSRDAATDTDHDTQGFCTPASTRHNSQALTGSGGALPWQDSFGITSSGALQGSGGTCDVSTCDVSTYSTGMASQRFGTTASTSSRMTGMDDRLSSVSALLKARTDAAVLRDLKVGPLLGRGSYGRVYKGRWKATPVAVKIIEHHAAGARSSEGKAVSAGRETLLGSAVSHPNVVTTYHISTMTISERSAHASSWLENGGPSSSQQATQQELEDDCDSDGSTISSDLEESPPDISETWVIMEFCEKGSLERAVRLGKFKQVEGQGQLVGIYKALLDTVSGLDYLHSIGVVHGDLKTANVLLKGSTRDARGVTCKITDFGLSRVLDPEATHISTGTYGTIVYMPKELLLSGRMTQATDIYSFGLMMWELFTCQPVMQEGLSLGQMFYMIAYEGWRPEIPANCPPDYAELMTACWHDDPEQRPTAQQLLRRLQKLYVQAKQQFIAARGAQPSARSLSRSSRRAAAAAAAAAAAVPSSVVASPLQSGGSHETGAVGSSRMAGTDSNSGEGNAVFGTSPLQQPLQHWQQQQQQQQHWHQQQAPQLQQMGSLRGSVTCRTSTPLASSIEEGSTELPRPPRTHASHSRRSNDTSISGEYPASYQPYAEAVLRQSISTSSPVPTPAPERVHVPMQADQILQLQQQLPQLQDPAAQQQLLQSYAVFLPPMLPIVASPSTNVGFKPVITQQDDATQAGEADLFDEDGMASESLLLQLTNPSNALFGNMDYGGVEFEDQYSGYLHGPSAADSTPLAAPGQSMQQTVEQYRQQLLALQQQQQQ